MTKKPNSNKDLLGDHLRAAYQDTLDEGIPESFAELIDTNLKKAFQETIDEGVPDRFALLMDKLKATKAGEDDA